MEDSTTLQSKLKTNAVLSTVVGIIVDRLVAQLPKLIDDLIDKALGEEEDFLAQPEEASVPDEKKVVAIRTRIVWVSRKIRPFEPRGGRFFLTVEQIADIIANPPRAFLRATDRVGIELTPFDSNGDGFGGEKPLHVIHNISGDALVETDEENDYSPVIVVPRDESDIRPDFEGEFTYQVTSEEGIFDSPLALQIKQQ